MLVKKNKAWESVNITQQFTPNGFTLLATHTPSNTPMMSVHYTRDELLKMVELIDHEVEVRRAELDAILAGKGVQTGVFFHGRDYTPDELIELAKRNEPLPPPEATLPPSS